MHPKKIIAAIKDPNLDLQERMFRLLTSVALISFFLAICIDYFLSDNAFIIITLIIGFLLFYLITDISIRKGKTRIGAVIVGLLLIFVVFPVQYISRGGLYSGGALWFIICIAFISLSVYGKMRYILYGCAVVSISVCYYIACFYPSLVPEQSVQAAYLDSLISLLLVSAMISALFIFESDIFLSERRLANEQKKEIEEINQSQNRFFTNMSHEIRTPINTIIGLNEMIMREDISDEVAEDARNIQAASRMLLSVVNDILDMSKIESGEMNIIPVAYDVGDMLSDIVSMIWIRAKEKGLEFHVDIDQTMPAQLYGDEVRIKQILLNILSNAIKYTQEGSVTLSIQCKKATGNKVEVTYSVSDTGMGIKKENIPYLFTAFRRVDQKQNRYIEGTGLGLAIVKQFVDLMGGQITVNSVYTKGSTFVVELEQEIADSSEIGQVNLEKRHAMHLHEHYKQSFEAPEARVLLVDDNETNQMVATKLLRDTKVQIDTASSGEEALRKTVQTDYHMIFMDHLMPGMDGIECFHKIRSQAGGLNKETPVVALTANAGSDSQALYYREGFDGYLLKPVSGELLEEELRKHLPKELVKSASEFELMGDLGTLVKEHRKKISVLITADSTCDLPKQMVKQLNIPILPYHLHTEGGYFLDGVETDSDGILAYMGDGREMARSEAAEVSEYELFFADQLTKAQHIIHIAAAQHVSKGYENAVEASKAFENVTVIDSGHLTCGMGLLVLYANRRANEDVTAEMLIQELEQVKKRIRTTFIVNGTEHLARAGRIRPWIHAISKALMLHPILVMKKSKMKVGNVRIGRKSQAWRQYVSSVLNTTKEIDREILFIAHVGLSVEELKEIEEMVRKKVNFEKVIYQKAAPAISINSGPGSFGLLFMTKS